MRERGGALAGHNRRLRVQDGAQRQGGCARLKRRERSSANGLGFRNRKTARNVSLGFRLPSRLLWCDGHLTDAGVFVAGSPLLIFARRPRSPPSPPPSLSLSSSFLSSFVLGVRVVRCTEHGCRRLVRPRLAPRGLARALPSARDVISRPLHPCHADRVIHDCPPYARERG